MNACEKCVFAVHDNKPHCGLRGFRSDFNVEYCSAENDTIPNGYELQEDGYFSWVKKKREYPKTYAECSDILSVYTDPDISGYKGELLWAFQKLLICRDAYWKLYGEEMGLGKPWEPDWDNLSTNHEFIKINKGYFTYLSRAFVFPTEEMRDAFYENFKELIEICKELL